MISDVSLIHTPRVDHVHVHEWFTYSFVFSVASYELCVFLFKFGVSACIVFGMEVTHRHFLAPNSHQFVHNP
jgi:hypothetical protein